MVFSDIFHSKIINYKYKGDGASLMAPQHFKIGPPLYIIISEIVFLYELFGNFIESDAHILRLI